MTQNNRIPRPSRWPADPSERIRRAMVDIDFVAALDLCGCDWQPSWHEIDVRAWGIIEGAAAELKQQAREKRDG